MISILIRWAINAVALWVAAQIIPGVDFASEASVLTVLLVALIFGAVNAIIRPFLALVTCPFYIFTLGLFTFVVNALMLMLTSWFAGSAFLVDGFFAAFLASLVISLISTVLSTLLISEPEPPADEVVIIQDSSNR